jgi:hypothetical protein
MTIRRMNSDPGCVTRDSNPSSPVINFVAVPRIGRLSVVPGEWHKCGQAWAGKINKSTRQDHDFNLNEIIGRNRLNGIVLGKDEGVLPPGSPGLAEVDETAR